MPELGFQYELTRSDRRTLSIKISRDAKVLVYAPRRMSLKHIEDFLFEKRGKFAWQAKNRKSWEECPDSSVWKASFEMTGFFTKELKIYISAPKAANCAHLTPDFRQNVLQRSAKQE